MYLGRADEIRIESDEDGFELWIETDHGTWSVRLSEPEQLYDSVRGRIGPWVREMHDAKASYSNVIAFRCDPDESGGYEISDPKHPDHHSVHADIYDLRSGK